MMIKSEIKIRSLTRIALVLTITGISLASFMIIGSGTSATSTFGQINSLQANSSSSDLLTINDDNVLDTPFYTENTKSTNIKVITVDPIPTVEVTYTGNSTIDGAPTQTIGTIVDKMNTDGSVASKGQAIILTASGQVITYNSESIGTYNPDGSFSDSGVMVFHLPFKMNAANSTSSSSNATETDPFAQYNNLFGIYKKTVDPEGNGLTKVWKWR